MSVGSAHVGRSPCFSPIVVYTSAGSRSRFVYHLAHRIVENSIFVMIYAIAAIQRLKLCFCVDAINACSAQLLLCATQVLRQIIRPKPHDYALANDLKSPCGVLTQNMLCTWRPTFCMDIFLYFGRDQRITVGLLMELDCPIEETLGRTWRRCCWENTTSSQQNTAKDPALHDKHDITMGNENLSKALQHQTSFTECEWAAFGITALGTDDYIRCGDLCFKPVSRSMPEVEIKYFTPETTESAGGIPECVCFCVSRVTQMRTTTTPWWRWCTTYSSAIPTIASRFPTHSNAMNTSGQFPSCCRASRSARLVSVCSGQETLACTIVCNRSFCRMHTTK